MSIRAYTCRNYLPVTLVLPSCTDSDSNVHVQDVISRLQSTVCLTLIIVNYIALRIERQYHKPLKPDRIQIALKQSLSYYLKAKSFPGRLSRSIAHATVFWFMLRVFNRIDHIVSTHTLYTAPKPAPDWTKAVWLAVIASRSHSTSFISQFPHQDRSTYLHRHYMIASRYLQGRLTLHVMVDILFCFSDWVIMRPCSAVTP